MGVSGVESTNDIIDLPITDILPWHTIKEIYYLFNSNNEDYIFNEEGAKVILPSIEIYKNNSYKSLNELNNDIQLNNSNFSIKKISKGN